MNNKERKEHIIKAIDARNFDNTHENLEGTLMPLKLFHLAYETK
ncbi:hypothetical protein N476_22070 [Pseudoalteromonas luteoviolacea H33]|uniref:Uncharacterized protein n=1 Tax=Pseudoalteromonas luteoviolacea H33 TaxID=1365251 RepID=A0A161XYB5_9GAMM|nr:hypothetical protein N476_22070 [Pseudoalteromonas luteoviolacea H33]KZN70046.1 hypothetical protein N477_25975 [Pseudoalteromonas luteoviolacea H33-S]